MGSPYPILLLYLSYTVTYTLYGLLKPFNGILIPFLYCCSYSLNILNAPTLSALNNVNLSIYKPLFFLLLFVAYFLLTSGAKGLTCEL